MSTIFCLQSSNELIACKTIKFLKSIIAYENFGFSALKELIKCGLKFKKKRSYFYRFVIPILFDNETVPTVANDATIKHVIDMIRNFDLNSFTDRTRQASTTNLYNTLSADLHPRSTCVLPLLDSNSRFPFFLRETSFPPVLKKGLLAHFTSTHDLHEERGRYCNPKTPRENRVCHFCQSNKVQNLRHVFVDCPDYAPLVENLRYKCNTDIVSEQFYDHCIKLVLEGPSDKARLVASLINTILRDKRLTS